MTLKTTLMRAEINEIPAAVDRLLSQGEAANRRIAAEFVARNPAFAVTVARGSSDHACTYLKYVAELLLGLPVASVGPSVASIYDAPLKVAGSVSISVSQSGKSPDIVELTRNARRGGAFAVAITNDATSPLAETASDTLEIHAGPELSVAATKTFVTSAVAGLRLLATVKQDQELLAAIATLPEALEKACRTDWSPAMAAIDGDSLFTLGRGPSWAMSNEAALKFKETCQIHAESYSSAEVLHGPVSIVDSGFPVLAFAAADAAEDAVVDVAESISQKGANVFVTSDKVRNATQLEHVRTGHWLTDPISLIVSFYGLVEKVAAARGINPDMPRHLKKVTETV